MPLLFEESYDTMVGPVMPVTVSNEDTSRSVVARGLVDTGSTYCGITGEMVEELGLDAFGKREMITPMGTTLTSVYFIGLRLPNSHKVYTIGATGCAPQKDFDMLIGRNVIRLGLLRVKANWFSFQIPPGKAAASLPAPRSTDTHTKLSTKLKALSQSSAPQRGLPLIN